MQCLSTSVLLNTRSVTGRYLRNIHDVRKSNIVSVHGMTTYKIVLLGNRAVCTEREACKMGTVSLSLGKSGRGVAFTAHPILAPRSRVGRSIPVPAWQVTGQPLPLPYRSNEKPEPH